MGAIAYETDFYTWALEQAALLRAGRFAELDLEHIAGEIEDMGKAERNQLRNRLTVLLMHLLKWQYEPSRRGSSWVNTIREQRRAIVWLIEDNPSLKASLDELLSTAYDRAIDEAADETSLPVQTFQHTCPWTYAQIVTRDFWPESAE
jgi:hypothetical protein